MVTNSKISSSTVMGNLPKEKRRENKTTSRYNQRQKAMTKYVQILMQ